MVLSLKDLFIGGESIAFDYMLDMSDFEAAPGEFPIREPVNVSGSAVNRASVTSINAHAKLIYSTRCDRCLKEIVEQIEVSFENVLAAAVEHEGDGDIIVCENETLDLDELVVTNIILNLSMKHLCSQGCKGLCPKCGKDLNDGDCDCDKSYVNPAFSQLRDMIKE
jgi:uncharacterized protein